MLQLFLPFFFGLFLAGSSYLFLPDHYVYADNTIFNLSPTLISIKTKSPADINFPLHIENLSNGDVVLEVILRPFTPGKTEGVPQVYINFNNDLLLRKIEIKDSSQMVIDKELKLGPKSKKTLIVHIPVSGSDPESDHYFSIFFITEPPKPPEVISQDIQASSLIRTGVAATVLLSINDHESESVMVSDFTTNSFIQHGPVPFRVLVTNKGRHFVRLNGQVGIKNIFGQEIGSISLLPANILANSSRTLSSESSHDSNLDNLQNQAVIWGEIFLLGPYTATLSLVNPDGTIVLEKTTHFFAFPYGFGLGIVLIILLIGFLISRVKKKLSS